MKMYFLLKMGILQCHDVMLVFWGGRMYESIFDHQLTALHIVGHSWKRLYSTR